MRAMRRADALYLATDRTARGEAISWHVTELLKERGALADQPVYRVQFHEITRRAVREAIEHPGELQANLVSSQLARRALDYLVGFNLSPVLWSKIRRNLSAGRVQSPALRLIADREAEIEAFETREYWTILADAPGPPPFSARLVQYRGDKVEQFTFTGETAAFAAQATLKLHAARGLEVLSVTAKKRRRASACPVHHRHPPAGGVQPARVQREPDHAHRAGAVRRMGGEGLITYMRTDSVSLASEAIAEIRAVIADTFGADEVPASPPRHRTRTRNAQEAHEAVRPTSAAQARRPLRGSLSRDQQRLYELIWRRAVASQMKPAVMNDVTVDLGCGKETSSGQPAPRWLRRGFSQSTRRSRPGPTAGAADAAGPVAVGRGERTRPDVPRRGQGSAAAPAAPARQGPSGDRHRLSGLSSTSPGPRPVTPRRPSSASWNSAGSPPSTYAGHHLQAPAARLRGASEAALSSDRRGAGWSAASLPSTSTAYVDYGFTASMEDDLDAISEGRKAWVPVLDEFWRDFDAQVRDKQQTVTRQQVTQQVIDEQCPECGRTLAIRLGRSGNFISCTGFPACRYARSLPRAGDGEADDGTGAGRRGEGA